MIWVSAKWTPERDEQLKAMRAMGLSYGVIAERLGVTKNSAIGRGMRMGLRVGGAQPRVHFPRKRGPDVAPRRSPKFFIKPSTSPPPDPVTAQIRSRAQSLLGPERIIEATP